MVHNEEVVKTLPDASMAPSNRRSSLGTRSSIYLVLSAAFALRAWGMWYGLPSEYVVDEPFYVLNALSMGARRTLEPLYFVYPSLSAYVHLMLFGLYFVIGKVVGAFHSTMDFGAQYFLNPTGFYLLGRGFSVAVGTATPVILFIAGRRFFSKGTGLGAALLLTLSFTHADYSHWAVAEALMVFLAAFTLDRILAYLEEPTVQKGIVASLFTGLTISTKYTAGFLVLPLFLASIFSFRREPAKLVKGLLLTGFACIAGFLVASPYWLFSFRSFVHDLSYTVTHVNVGMVGQTTKLRFLWPFLKLLRWETTVGLVFLAGIFWAFWRFNQKVALLLSFIVPTWLFVGSWTRVGLHYTLATWPALALLGGGAAAEVLNRFAAEWRLGRGQWTRWAFAAVILIPTARIAYSDFRLTQHDTRHLAEEWIEKTIPFGSVVAYENYVLGPNLFDPDRFLSREREGELIPEPIAMRLREETKHRAWYRLVNFRRENPAAVRWDSKNSNPFAEKMLSFEYLSLAELRQRSVKYVVISSDNYARYFQRPPKEESVLWQVYRRGRDFYETVLTSKELTLVKEFKPGRWNPGPVLKIYQFPDRK